MGNRGTKKKEKNKKKRKEWLNKIREQEEIQKLDFKQNK